jgi:cytosine/adenosine deaminase-related metal-dependent hydrolase
MTMQTLYRVRTLVTMAGAPIHDGAVLVAGSRIAAAGAYPEVKARAGTAMEVDLGERVLLPGLINAHCHLDYTMLRNAISSSGSFVKWIARLNAVKRGMGDDDYVKAITMGFVELRRWGTTTVCNMEAFPELLLQLPPPPIRTWWFLELIDIRSRIPTEAFLAGALAFFEGRPGWLGGFGLNPHAPYTASPELYRLCAACAERYGLLLTTHVAESREEEAMFRHASGELHDFLRQLGRRMDDCGKASAFSNLAGNGLIGPGWLLAHANEMDEADVARIASHASPGDWHLVHCPRSRAYFNHRPFPWKALEAAGATISLGTDSLASNDSLNLFEEMRTAQAAFPWLTSEALLRTVTVNPARALKQEGQLGKIAPGAFADMIALPYTGAAGDVYDTIVTHTHPVEWMMLDGNFCY